MFQLLRSAKVWLGLLIVLSGVFLSLSSLRAQEAPLDGGNLAGGSEALTGGNLAGGSEALTGEISAQLVQQLGIPAQEIQQLREQSTAGGVGGFESQRLCASIAAKHISPNEAQSIGHALGLSDDDVRRLVNCARLSYGPSNRLGQGAGQNPVVPAGPSLVVPAGPSLIERQFHAADTPYKLLAAPDLNQLEQFGYDLFSSGTQDLSSFDNVPVSADYVVGPGDDLNVLLWGRINRTLHLTVQRDGSVLMPQVGPLAVAGLNFDQARKLIASQVGQIEGVQTDVTMGRLRTMEVLVIGQVAAPGLHTVSALVTVSDALTAAGGVRKQGSLRRIELRRGGRPVADIDLYAMLLRGDTSSDLRLQPRDVIFVPAIGPVVGVAGDVKNPAIYELRGPENLASVIKMASGVGAFGFAQRVQVERVQNHQARIGLDVNLGSPRARAFAIDDGDLVKVFTVLPERRNVVKLNGNVNRPGAYQWRAGMRVADLIREGQGVRDDTFFDYALLQRRADPARKSQFLRINLSEALSSEDPALDSPLEPGDALTIYSAGEINEIPTVSVAGKVRKPGAYPLTDGMRVRDLIYEAGGLKREAYLARAQLARTISNGSRAQYIDQDLSLGEVLAGAPGGNIALEPGDALFIAEVADWHSPWTVQVKGEVLRPGPYVIHEEERLSTVLEECGGLRSGGYIPALILLRESTRKMQQENLKHIETQVDAELTRAALMPSESSQQQQADLRQKAEALTMLKGMLTQSAQNQAIGRIVLDIPSFAGLAGSRSDLALENGDQIIIPRVPTWVNVMGQVYGATAIAYDPALTVREYIDRAGGLTADADKDQIFVVKANGAVLSAASFSDMGSNHIFPLLPLISGGFMTARLEPGDTVYVPASFLFVNPLRRTLDITQIIANTAQGIAYAALLGSML